MFYKNCCNASPFSLSLALFTLIELFTPSSEVNLCLEETKLLMASNEVVKEYEFEVQCQSLKGKSDHESLFRPCVGISPLCRRKNGSTTSPLETEMIEKMKKNLQVIRNSGDGFLLYEKSLSAQLKKGNQEVISKSIHEMRSSLHESVTCCFSRKGSYLKMFLSRGPVSNNIKNLFIALETSSLPPRCFFSNIEEFDKSISLILKKMNSPEYMHGFYKELGFVSSDIFDVSSKKYKQWNVLVGDVSQRYREGRPLTILEIDNFGESMEFQGLFRF
ncbi:MAG: hypothetical protein GY714_23160 [Desulfobacterales bacterium]|nr:hypothetical protein [Desulfobacterales bacterium]